MLYWLTECKSKIKIENVQPEKQIHILFKKNVGKIKLIEK